MSGNGSTIPTVAELQAMREATDREIAECEAKLSEVGARLRGLRQVRALLAEPPGDRPQRNSKKPSKSLDVLEAILREAGRPLRWHEVADRLKDYTPAPALATLRSDLSDPQRARGRFRLVAAGLVGLADDAPTPQEAVSV